MALARWPTRWGQQHSFRRIRQFSSWALPRSPGARRRVWERLAIFCDSGLFRPRYGVMTC